MSSRLAKIKVPKKSSEEYSISTGYAIKRGFLIVAKHALTSPKRDSNKPIIVEWIEITDPNTNKVMESKISTTNDTLLLEGYDIAIIKCDTPQYSQTSLYLLTESYPSIGADWNTRGFPRIGRIGGKDEPTSEIGKLVSDGSNQGRIELNTGSNLKTADNWKGISGAPILVSNFIIGIIVEKKRDHEHRLEGVSIPFLLRNSELFCDFLGIKKQTSDFSKAKKILENKEILNSLIKQLPIYQGSDSINDCINYLKNIDIGKLVNHIHKAQSEADGNKSLCKDLGHFLLAMLPTLFDETCAENIRESSGNSSQSIIAIPYTTKVSAEMLMACADQRESMFKTFSKKNIEATFNLPLPPEVGTDDGSKTQDAVTDHFYECFGGGIHRDLATHMTDFIYEEEVPQDLFPEKSVDAELKIELVKSYLEQRNEEKEPSYYWIVKPSENESKQKSMLQLANRLKLAYPHIVIISLENDLKKKVKEGTDYMHLTNTLSYTHKN